MILPITICILYFVAYILLLLSCDALRSSLIYVLSTYFIDLNENKLM